MSKLRVCIVLTPSSNQTGLAARLSAVRLHTAKLQAVRLHTEKLQAAGLPELDLRYAPLSGAGAPSRRIWLDLQCAPIGGRGPAKEDMA